MNQAVAAGARPLDGRVVLVAGACGGLGHEASLACARAGATLVLLGRKVPRLNRLHDAVSGEGADAVLYPLDMEGASFDDYVEMAARVQEAFGRLDGILHCAASFRGLTPLEHTDPAQFLREWHVNLTARWWLSQACLPLLKEAGDPALVFVIDATHDDSPAYRGAYGLAQQAQKRLVEMLHAENAGGSLRVSGLTPTPLRTPLRARACVVDEDRVAQVPSSAASACVTLLSAEGARHRGLLWNGVS